MANWITHLMIADKLLIMLPGLDRRGFCVGNIAPDCNLENETWTAFIPPRAVTHWMQNDQKKASDCEAFYKEYLLARKEQITSNEQYSFLLGYYAHLLTDAAFQAMIRDENRVKAVWERIKAHAPLRQACLGMEESWGSAKRLIPKSERMKEIDAIEAAYLIAHPDSGYLTEILPLTEFPDYIDYLPHGCYVRKVGVMGRLPKPDENVTFLAISPEEYAAFVEQTTKLVYDQLAAKMR